MLEAAGLTHTQNRLSGAQLPAAKKDLCMENAGQAPEATLHGELLVHFILTRNLLSTFFLGCKKNKTVSHNTPKFLFCAATWVFLP